MERITPATIPRPRITEHERPRLAYSTSSTPGTIRGFLKPNTTPTETIAATGMLRAGRHLLAITAKQERELQNSIRRHTCAGCQQIITGARITTATEEKAYGHHSNHHHWHETCFKQSEASAHEHALERWAIINWEEN